MTEETEVNETEEADEKRRTEILQAVQTLRKNLEKRGFSESERAAVGAYLMSYELVDSEIAAEEETSARDTFFAGIGILQMTLGEVEAELYEALEESEEGDEGDEGDEGEVEVEVGEAEGAS